MTYFSIRLAATALVRRTRASAAFALVVGTAVSATGTKLADSPRSRLTARWTAEEREALRSLSLAALPPLPPDPSNRVADDARAAALGEALFFDKRLSGNGQVSCGSCHDPARDFQDGVALARGVGTTTRRTMPIAGTAHSPWHFWDGRADSQWAQALGPLESAVEHGGSRVLYAHVVSEHHRADYEAIFGPLPLSTLRELPRHAGPVSNPAWRAAWERIPAARRDEVSRVYANMGKAIAAFERRIGFAPSRFDRYVATELAGRPHTPASAFSADEAAGLRLFIGKGSCINCHNGARFTDDHFHNTGIPVPATPLPPDSGRATGALAAVNGEFRCTGPYSDAPAGACTELEFAVTDGEELVRAYKTPSLRGVAARAPYMHAGQLASLTEVIAHYDRAPRAPAGHSELRPLRLNADERRQLEAFLRTLDVGSAKLGDPRPHAGPLVARP